MPKGADHAFLHIYSYSARSKYHLTTKNLVCIRMHLYGLPDLGGRARRLTNKFNARKTALVGCKSILPAGTESILTNQPNNYPTKGRNSLAQSRNWFTILYCLIMAYGVHRV